MRKTNNKQNKPTNIISVLFNRSIANSWRYVISGEGTYYEQGTERISSIEFENRFPTDILRSSVKGDLIGNNI